MKDQPIYPEGFSQIWYNYLHAYFSLCLQIGLSVSTGLILGLPEAQHRMKIPTEKHVELFCNLPLYEFLTPLMYNLILILICAIYGFLTRKLPENFNESWYIFVSVCTTIFLWLVFLPAYFTMFYAYNQAALLAFCLFLNATISLFCIYAPKIYALYFVDDEKISTFSFTEGTNMTDSKGNVTMTDILSQNWQLYSESPLTEKVHREGEGDIVVRFRQELLKRELLGLVMCIKKM